MLPTEKEAGDLSVRNLVLGSRSPGEEGPSRVLSGTFSWQLLPQHPAGRGAGERAKAGQAHSYLLGPIPLPAPRTAWRSLHTTSCLHSPAHQFQAGV